ncbi:MAG: hypothetical protein LBQ20_09220 [Rhodanobacter sp.]|jgi:hypothetical protein|nr:hypothetical protein [Rhodanobacter sp.]
MLCLRSPSTVGTHIIERSEFFEAPRSHLTDRRSWPHMEDVERAMLIEVNGYNHQRLHS